MTVSVAELERKIFEMEGIRIVIRCARETNFIAYSYERKASDNTIIGDWIDNRLIPIIGNCQYEIINGYGVSPHRRTKLKTIRNSYVE